MTTSCSTATSTTASRWKFRCECHSESEFARGKSHVNGIENFWSFAKRRLAKSNGRSSDAFVLHLKECEWRYNHRREDLLPLLKRLCSKAYFD